MCWAFIKYPLLSSDFQISVKLWIYNLFPNHRQGSIKSNKININNDIFQEISLYPLLFCLALLSRTSECNATKHGSNKFEKTVLTYFIG